MDAEGEHHSRNLACLETLDDNIAQKVHTYIDHIYCDPIAQLMPLLATECRLIMKFASSQK